jgi:hypothetical protein
MPPASAGLLAHLDALVDLVDHRRGRVLTPGGALARSEARAVAQVTGLAAADAGEAGLLVPIAVAVGVVRVRGLRVELTALRPAWKRLDAGLRAGVVDAAWCHRVPWPAVLGSDPPVERLHHERLWVPRFLHGLAAGVEVDVAALASTVAERAGLPTSARPAGRSPPVSSTRSPPSASPRSCRPRPPPRSAYASARMPMWCSARP